MKNKTVLLLVVAAFAMGLSSCVATHQIHYKPVVKEGAGQHVENTFIVSYGDFNLGYNVNGRVAMENASDSVIYIDMYNSRAIDTTGLEHFFYRGARRELTDLKSEARLYGDTQMLSVVPDNVPVRYIGINPHTTVYLPYPALPRPQKGRLQDAEGQKPFVMPCGSHVMCYAIGSSNPTWKKTRVDLTTDYDLTYEGSKGFADAEDRVIESTNATDIVNQTALTSAGKVTRMGIILAIAAAAVAIPLIVLLKK